MNEDLSVFLQARLAESGAKKLAQLFTKNIAEASSSAVLDPVSYLPSPPAFIPTISPSTITSLGPLVTSLRALPIPSSHPSHPAADDILKMLQEAQQGYADMRSGWAKKCLEPGAKRIMASAENEIAGVDSGRDFGLWVEGMLALAEVSQHSP